MKLILTDGTEIELAPQSTEEQIFIGFDNSNLYWVEIIHQDSPLVENHPQAQPVGRQ